MDIKKPTNIIKAIDFYIPRFKGMENNIASKGRRYFCGFLSFTIKWRNRDENPK